ncbi:MAG: hypothetical protein A2Y84_00710 [Candidatus Colwellbacteria bacterium RBG_13_48_8]|uniref:Nudix hydrolase domain-containing protein n=1 Tax=Candidatus Colwellbacteria bacterium RBG_13_48_8 TaxID=1797685 RepID=A0A1G1YX58_9BACT|nr:MAG: hypothetical protein A2Y84_00710 [Candidatus Colwellbacteria bacterium RBG_13_48_8]
MKEHGIVAIVHDGNKYLLLEDARDLMLGKWAPPHGRCEVSDKSEEECVARETYEETQLKIKPIKKLWTQEADTKVKTVSFWLVKILEGEIKIEDESSHYGWFTLDEVLELDLYPGTKKFFELVEKGEVSI